MPFDFAAIHAPFRMQPGLRRVQEGSTALVALEPGSPVFEQKLAVLARHREHALVSVPDFDARPALAALAAQAALDCPEAIRWDGQVVRACKLDIAARMHDGELLHGPACVATGLPVLLALPGAWRAAALLSLALRADFAVVDGAQGTVPWIAACLPSHWDPAEKVGHHFTQIHGPVADNAMLLTAGAHLMRLVCEPQRWERFVWTLTPNARHDQHPHRGERVHWPPGAGASVTAAAAYLRTEHQTFIPLPLHRQAVFTIDVEVRPLVTAITRVHDARQMHEALATMSDAVLAYRGLSQARAPLLEWLKARAAQAE